MPSDPSNPPPVPDHHLELPDDLSALAEQLKADALHLSSKYPAQISDCVSEAKGGAAERIAEPTSDVDLVHNSQVEDWADARIRITGRRPFGPKWKFSIWIAAATALLILVLLGPLRQNVDMPSQSSLADRNAEVLPSASSPHAQSKTNSNQPRILTEPNHRTQPASAVFADEALLPSIKAELLQGMTGPELEAWLDLLEQDSTRKESISI